MLWQGFGVCGLEWAAWVWTALGSKWTGVGAGLCHWGEGKGTLCIA